MAWMSEPRPSDRRTGDAIQIDGSYQHRALTDGPPVQRFWHRSKLLLLDWMFPVTAGQNVLDVGCGSGVFAAEMAKRGARVLGVDANPSAIEYAQTTFAGDGLSFQLGLLDELELPEQSFDRASCLEIVEHVYPEQVQKLLADISRLLRPGGQVLVTTPNYRGLWPVIEWAADRFSSAAKMDAEQHVTHFHRRMLQQFVERAGLRILHLRTYSTLAPFVAPASERLATRFEHWERSVDLPFGNLLALVAERPS